jgi:hypothetical protein
VLEKQQATQEKAQRFEASFRHGDGVSEILGVELLNADGLPCMSVAGGETVTVRVLIRFHRPARDPMVGILIRNRIGMDVYGTNTRIEKKHLGCYQAGDELEVDFQFDCWLTPQQYTLTVATQSPDGSSHDWLDDVIPFDVVDARIAAGVANLRAEIAWRASR